MFPIAGVIQKKSLGAITPDYLLKFHPDTFGYALGNHMKTNKLDFIQGFEEHDMKHLLLGYEVTVPSEIRLSAFEFGAGSRSFMTLGVFLFGIPLALDLWPEMWRDYKHGLKFKSYRKLKLKQMLNYDFDLMMKITPKCPDYQE
jgi:ubiquinone biosynthesis protein Coq4